MYADKRIRSLLRKFARSQLSLYGFRLHGVWSKSARAEWVKTQEGRRDARYFFGADFADPKDSSTTTFEVRRYPFPDALASERDAPLVRRNGDQGERVIRILPRMFGKTWFRKRLRDMAGDGKERCYQ